MALIPVESLGALIALAIADSFSFGTLLIPVWLLMAPGSLRLGRIVLYLATVTLAYFVIGIVLMSGGRVAFSNISGLLESRPFLIGQFATGAVLLILSFALDTKAARARAAERSQRSGRLRRWRERAMGETSAGFALATLAITAVLVEVASMLPYIAGTALIAGQAPMWPAALVLLAGYCLVMVTPAIVLATGRLVANTMVDAPLRRLDTWLTRNARSSTLWIIGIVGFFLAGSAVQSLEWIPSD